MAEVKIKLIDNLQFDANKNRFDLGNDKVRKYFKGFFSSKGRFIKNFSNRYTHVSEIQEFIEETENMWDELKPFTYKEAFEIEDDNFKSLVFGTIDIGEMIQELGIKRKIAVDGKKVKRKIFSESGEFLGYKEYDNIYETHEIDGTKLELVDPIYVLKCWCTSTNKEHWLWIKEEYADDPLEAVASTFYVYEKIIPYIKELKRQGDLMFVELTEDVNVEPTDKQVPLTKEQYFKWLTTET